MREKVIKININCKGDNFISERGNYVTSNFAWRVHNKERYPLRLVGLSGTCDKQIIFWFKFMCS